MSETLRSELNGLFSRHFQKALCAECGAETWLDDPHECDPDERGLNSMRAAFLRPFLGPSDHERAKGYAVQ